MKNRDSVRTDKPEVRTGCRHYWIIEAASGPVSRGVCKFCGAEQEFQNSWPGANYMGRDAGVFDLPDMLEEEAADSGD